METKKDKEQYHIARGIEGDGDKPPRLMPRVVPQTSVKETNHFVMSRFLLE